MAEGAKSSPKGGFQFKVRGPRDFYGGLALIALAIIAILSSSDLPGMRGFAFGPGTAPRMFATLLAAIGGLVALSGLLVDGPPIDKFAVRGPAYVLVAILVFAGLIRGVSLSPLGMLDSSENLLSRNQVVFQKGLQQDAAHFACTKHRYPQPRHGRSGT